MAPFRLTRSIAGWAGALTLAALASRYRPIERAGHEGGGIVFVRDDS